MRLNQTRRWHRWMAVGLVVGLSALVASPSAFAALLGPGNNGLQPTGVADVTTQYIGIQYTLDVNPLTGTFQAGGALQAYPDLYVVDGSPAHHQNIDTNTSTFDLTMTVNRADGSLVSGTLSITGEITNDPWAGGTTYPLGTLLQGDITAFGFSAGAPGEFDFIINVTGGELAAPGAPYAANHTAGMVMLPVDIGSPAYAGVFTAPFQNNLDNTNGQADTFAMVPEPSCFVLLAIGLVPLAWRLRRPRMHHPA